MITFISKTCIQISVVVLLPSSESAVYPASRSTNHSVGNITLPNASWELSVSKCLPTVKDHVLVSDGGVMFLALMLRLSIVSPRYCLPHSLRWYDTLRFCICDWDSQIFYTRALCWCSWIMGWLKSECKVHISCRCRFQNNLSKDNDYYAKKIMYAAAFDAVRFYKIIAYTFYKNNKCQCYVSKNYCFVLFTIEATFSLSAMVNATLL